MPKNDKNHHQDIAITKLEGRADAVEDDIREIKIQLTNHIPTQIRKMGEKVEKDNKTTNDKVDKLNDKILWGFIVMISSTLILQVILKFYN